MTDARPATAITFPAPMHARLVAIVARDLQDVVANEALSDRSRRLLWMIDGLLRHVIANPEHDGAIARDDSAVDAIERELADIRTTAEREATLSLASRAPDARKRLNISPEALTAWLHSRHIIAPAAAVSGIEQLLGGFSKETFRVSIVDDADTHGLILRRDVPLGPVDSSVIDEYPVLLALSKGGLTVAEPLGLETDRRVFGEPFLVSRQVAGTAKPNTEGLSVGPDQIEAARALAAFLGQLHAQNPGELGLVGRWNEPAIHLSDHIASEINAIEQSWRDNRQDISATIGAAIDWLRANIPNTGDEPTRVVHGDAGLHNLLMNEGKISAMLDWELAHPGDPTEDLSYCRTWVDQVLGWDTFIEIYRAHGGQAYHADRERFYAVLADVRVAVFAVRSQAHVRLSDQPEIPIAFGALYYSRIFREKVGRRLIEVL